MPATTGLPAATSEISTSAARSMPAIRSSASSLVISPSCTRSMAIRSAARGVRFAERVCRIHNLPSSMVNSTSCTSPNSRSSRFRISPSSAAMRRQRADDGLFGVGRAAAGDDVFALGVEHEIDHRLGEARRGIPRKRHAGAGRKSAIAEHHGLNRDRGALEMVEFLQTAIGLRPLAHPGPIDRPCGAFELRRRILQPAVVAILDQRLLVGGETFQRFAVELAVARDVFAGRSIRQGARRTARGRARARSRRNFPESAAGNPRPAAAGRSTGSGPARRAMCSRH